MLTLLPLGWAGSALRGFMLTLLPLGRAGSTLPWGQGPSLLPLPQAEDPAGLTLGFLPLGRA